jgi:flavin reductase (DIM6/NTAB) family NADH-FMN oxidoreductase RutF
VPGASLQLECELEQIVDGFGDNSLIVGKAVAARGREAVLRDPDTDDAELIRDAPVLAYLHPGRLAFVAETQAFPFPKGMRK